MKGYTHVLRTEPINKTTRYKRQIHDNELVMSCDAYQALDIVGWVGFKPDVLMID